jgi:hypothetical protein
MGFVVDDTNPAVSEGKGPICFCVFCTYDEPLTKITA